MKELVCKLCPDKGCYAMEGGRMVVVEEAKPKFITFTNVKIEDCNERLIYKATGTRKTPRHPLE
jgi:hypothetical protein